MVEELQPPPGEVELILRAILVRRVARALVLQHHHGLAQAAQKIEVLHALEERRCFIVVVLADQQRRLDVPCVMDRRVADRSEEHTSELQSLMRISYAVFCLKKKNQINTNPSQRTT